MSSTHRPKIDPTTLALGWLIVGMAAITTWDQWAIWSTKPDYSFGYLVPFFSAYVLYERWDALRSYFTGERSHVSALSANWLIKAATLVGFLSFLIFIGSGAYRAIFGTGTLPTLAITFGFVGTVLSFAFISVKGADGYEPTSATRWAALGLVLFPACVWIISGPFLFLVDIQIKDQLLTNVIEIVSGILRVSGETIRTNGNVIIFANNDAVGIADACSGIRSFSACIFVGAFLGAVFIEGTFPGILIRRILMIFLSGLGAILLNIIRNTYLAFYALNHGSHALDKDFWGIEHGGIGFSSLGTVHDFAGNASMVLAFLILVACVPLVNRFGRSTFTETTNS